MTTYAAAATRTLRSPRRRPHGPAAWESAGAVSGVVGAAALVVATSILSSAPSVQSAPAAVRAHLGNRYPITVGAAALFVGAAFLLVPFLRKFTARRTYGAQWRRTVTLVTGAIGIAMLALAGALLATAALLADRSTAEGVFADFVAAKLVATLALLPVAGLVLAHARTIARTQRRPDRWLIRFDIEIAIIAVFAAIASFIDHDWIAPGGPVAAGAWFLVALWVIALARTIVRGDHDNFSEEGS